MGPSQSVDHRTSRWDVVPHDRGGANVLFHIISILFISSDMQETIEDWNAPGVSSMWFDESKFESSDHFDSEQYVDDLKRYIPLETLKQRLIEYTEEMRGKLVELVNEDYDEFAALSTKLVNVEAAVTELEKPVFSAKSEIEHVRHKLMSHSTALKEAVQRRQEVADLKKSLELAKGAAQSMANVEKLVQALETDRSGIQNSLTSPHEELCKNLDRICSELGRLLYVIRNNNSVQTIASMKGHVDVLKHKVEANLEVALIQVLDQQDPVSLGTLLHAFSTIGNVSTPEKVIRNHVIAPCLRSATREGEISASELIRRMQNSMREDVWQFLEVAISTCSTSLPYDFPGESVFPEVVETVERLYPAMYSPGNPVGFRDTYAALEDLISDLEGLCVTRDQVVRFTNCPARSANKAKWNFAAYYSLCFQSIASSYEQKLVSPEEFFKTSEVDLSDVCSRCTHDVLESMQACLSQDVFILPIADKLIRLQLQILARFGDWVGCLEDYGSSREDLPSVAPKLVSLLYGSINSMQIADTLTPVVVDRIKDLEVVKLIQSSYEESEELLRNKVGILLEMASDKVAATCAECLSQIRGIVAAFRMTARTPTTAAQYSIMILKPLENLLADIAHVSELDALKFSRMVISKVADRFFQVAKETLETSRRTEESLKKLKSRKTNAPNDSANVPTDQMVALQLGLDVQEFVNKVHVIMTDANVEEIPSVQKLHETFVK